ncbi:hypothetical protein FGB62_149g022 [Gracilaria domingensis]|nr:hypothetical protein FGB62_149g022 [Gracilaria domingensis]
MPLKRPVPRLTENSEAVKRLRAMFRNGELTGEENATEVYHMDLIFKPFKIPTFRLRLKRIRDEMMNSFQNNVSQVIPRTTKDIDTIPAVPGSSKWNTGEADPAVLVTEGMEKNIVEDPKEFKPIILTSLWEHEKTTVQYLSLAILFTPSIQEKHHVSRVLEDGTVFVLTVQWPDRMVDMSMLHKKWLSTQFQAILSYHRMIPGLKGL